MLLTRLTFTQAADLCLPTVLYSGTSGGGGGGHGHGQGDGGGFVQNALKSFDSSEMDVIAGNSEGEDC